MARASWRFGSFTRAPAFPAAPERAFPYALPLAGIGVHPILASEASPYRFAMARRWSRQHRRFGVLLAVPLLLLTTTGCLTNAADGMVATPNQPGTSSSTSRLPQLLSQLQGSAGGGLELLDGSRSQVLAAQEAGGKDAAATVTGSPTPSIATPIGTARAGATATPRPESATVTATPRPGNATATSTANTNVTATATGTATATPTATAKPSATPTATAVPTATPIATPPSEGGGRGTPPSE